MIESTLPPWCDCNQDAASLYPECNLVSEIDFAKPKMANTAARTKIVDAIDLRKAVNDRLRVQRKLSTAAVAMMIAARGGTVSAFRGTDRSMGDNRPRMTRYPGARIINAESITALFGRITLQPTTRVETSSNKTQTVPSLTCSACQ